MIDGVTYERCSGCGACYAVCPHHAITMQVHDEEGFLAPVIDSSKCVQCGLCSRICPVIHKDVSVAPIRAFAAIHKDMQVRLRSTSGGIFTYLAQCMFEKHGVVCGAGWRSDTVAAHQIIESDSELDVLRGSKYVQSESADSYPKVRAYLEANRSVLFVGCPCQVAGLKHYLRRDYPELLCAALICNGVGSPEAFRLFKRSLDQCWHPGGKGHNGYVTFRDKLDAAGCPWAEHASRSIGRTTVAVKTRHQKFVLPGADTYVASSHNAASSLLDRPSCFSCAFRNFTSGADLVIGDYWGVEKVFPDFPFTEGCSAVITLSEKGASFFEGHLDRLIVRKSTVTDIAQCNPRLYLDMAGMHLRRKQFFKALQSRPLRAVALLRTFTQAPFHVRFIRQMKALALKIPGVAWLNAFRKGRHS